jgi:hypothetical protein
MSITLERAFQLNGVLERLKQMLPVPPGQFPDDQFMSLMEAVEWSVKQLEGEGLTKADDIPEHLYVCPECFCADIQGTGWFYLNDHAELICEPEECSLHHCEGCSVEGRDTANPKHVETLPRSDPRVWHVCHELRIGEGVE